MGALFLMLILSPMIDRYLQSRVSGLDGEIKNENENSQTEIDNPSDTED